MGWGLLQLHSQALEILHDTESHISVFIIVSYIATSPVLVSTKSANFAHWYISWHLRSKNTQNIALLFSVFFSSTNKTHWSVYTFPWWQPGSTRGVFNKGFDVARPFQVSFQCFDVVAWYIEEILLDLEGRGRGTKRANLLNVLKACFCVNSYS